MAILKDPKTGRFMKGNKSTNGFKKGNIPWIKGKHHSEETKEKMKGRHPKTEFKLGNHPKTEFKKGDVDNSGEKNPMYGKHHSGETKENIRLKNKGKHFSRKTEFKKGTHPKTEFKLENKINLGRHHHASSKIKQSAKKQGIDIKDWKKFISREPYSQDWNNIFKRRVRKRDNQICMVCGIHREKLNRVLDVHHINYDKKLTIPQNCISLCKSCHSKTTSNRQHWIGFFQSLLSEKYGYKYEDNKVIINMVEQNKQPYICEILD